MVAAFAEGPRDRVEHPGVVSIVGWGWGGGWGMGGGHKEQLPQRKEGEGSVGS